MPLSTFGNEFLNSLDSFRDGKAINRMGDFLHIMLGQIHLNKTKNLFVSYITLNRRKVVVLEMENMFLFYEASGRNFEGKTTGSPIGFIIKNNDQKSKDYSHIKDSFRPSHADFVYEEKYGHRDYRGGGRSSARETACRVVAGAVAKQIIKDIFKVQLKI